jgi:hypothetical protein
MSPTAMDWRFDARSVWDRANTGIMGLNLARDKDLCPSCSVLCFVVLFS